MTDRVKRALLAMQRYNWEQGVTAQAFLEAGGSSLQFNLLDHQLLLAAKKNPEQHKNLLVRVCGYSAAFVHLAEETQDEIIRRAIR